MKLSFFRAVGISQSLIDFCRQSQHFSFVEAPVKHHWTLLAGIYFFFSQAQRCSSFKFRYISKNCKYSFVCVCKIVPTLSTTKTCYVFHLKNYKKFTSKLSVWVFACHSPFLFGFCFSFTNKLNLKTRNFLLFFLSHRLMWIFLAPFESIHGEVPSVLFHIFKLLLLLAVDTLFSLPLLLHTRKKAAL